MLACSYNRCLTNHDSVNLFLSSHIQIDLIWNCSLDPESRAVRVWGMDTMELALLIAAPFAIIFIGLMVFFSVRHQKRRLLNSRHIDDAEHNMDSADVPILGKKKLVGSPSYQAHCLSC